MPSMSVMTEKRGMMDGPSGGVHVQMETFASVTEAPSDATLVKYDSDGALSAKPLPKDPYDVERDGDTNRDFFKKSNVQYYSAT